HELGESDQVFDADDLVIRLGNDSQLIRELVDLFLSSYPGRLEELKQSVAEGDARRTEFLAHSLKSSVGNFSAWAAFHAAERLEVLAKNSEMESATAACVELEQAIERLKPVLSTLGDR